jgi:hypothetical protein
VLVALYISHRNCRFLDSVNRKFLNNEKSRLVRPGASRMFRPELPYCSGAR